MGKSIKLCQIKYFIFTYFYEQPCYRDNCSFFLNFNSWLTVHYLMKLKTLCNYSTGRAVQKQVDEAPSPTNLQRFTQKSTPALTFNILLVCHTQRDEGDHKSFVFSVMLKHPVFILLMEPLIIPMASKNDFTVSLI